MEKKGLFVRPASGLVREVSTSRAFFFNVGSALAWTYAWAVGFLTYAPAWQLGGWSSVSWGTFIAGIFVMLVLAPIYSYLATALPRSGGEQVYTPRITSPMLGFIETWMFVFSIFAFMGFGISVELLNLSSVFSTMAVSTSEPWGSYASWLLGTNGTLIVGTLLMAIIVIISVQPSRRFHTINSVLVGLGLILAVLVVPALIGFDPAVFARNFQAFTGKSMKDVSEVAAAQGFSVGTFDISTLGLVLGFGITAMVGFQYSGFLAGELKGKISSNILLSMMGAAIVVILGYTVLTQLFISALGYEFLAALSYLSLAAPAESPIIPLTPTLIAIANPGLAPIMAFSMLGSFLIGLGLSVCWIQTATRTAFAWSMDRLIPAALSKIDPRTKIPLRLVVIFAAIWYISFLASVYGVSFITGALTSTLLALLIWIVPGINAILLPYRRPDLYELIPQSMRKKFGIPLVSILGVIWLLFSVPTFFLFAIWPIVAGAYGTHLASAVTFAVSQGLVQFAVILVVGIVIYYAARWYNRRHGIDIDMLFKSVPPE